MKSYKVLMYANTFINYDSLGEGLYSTKFPILFSKETTIESLVENFKKTIEGYIEVETFMRFENNSKYGKNFVENLLKCELKEVNLSYN